jgi:hypothetical protein
MIKHEDELCLTKRQSSFLIAAFMGCMMIMMIVAYVAGYRAALSEHLTKVQKNSFADEIFASAHGTYHVSQRNASEGDHYYVMVHTYELAEEEAAKEAVAYWQKQGISLMLRKRQKVDAQWYELTSTHMKKYEAKQLVTQLTREGKSASPQIVRSNEQVKGA